MVKLWSTRVQLWSCGWVCVQKRKVIVFFSSCNSVKAREGRERVMKQRHERVVKRNYIKVQ